jgi:hypothetical protein
MSVEQRQYVIADLLDNAIEPWDSLTSRELKALGASVDPDNPLTVPVVIAAYANERGPVLIDGSERLQWMASAPRNQTVISAEDVRIDQDAVDEESAHRAAVALRVNRRQTSPKARAVIARRLQAQFGWSQATIAEVFKVPGPAVSRLFSQWAGEIPEVTGADGHKYPARGKQTDQDKQDRPAASGSAGSGSPGSGAVGEALKVLYSDYLAAAQRDASVRQLKIDRHGTANPDIWTVTVPSQSADAAARLAGQLREQAAELIRLAGKLDPGRLDQGQLDQGQLDQG